MGAREAFRRSASRGGRLDFLRATSANASQKVVGNVRCCSDSSLYAILHIYHRPRPKMPSEETKVCHLLRNLCERIAEHIGYRRESSRPLTSHACVHDKSPSLVLVVLNISSHITDCRPLWLDSVHHLRRIHEEQPPTILDQVSSLRVILHRCVPTPPAGSSALSHDLAHTAVYIVLTSHIIRAPFTVRLTHVACCVCGRWLLSGEYLILTLFL